MSGEPSATPLDRLLAALQRPLPQHALSRLALSLAGVRWRPLKALLIGVFRRWFRVDLGQAAEPNPAAYPSFNAFFTRSLRPGARPLAGNEETVVCPVDGTVNRAGVAAGGTLVQAKGRTYTLDELLASPERAAPFSGGAYACLYLSPRDYHRIHMPLAGRLVETVHVPGRLYAVNPSTARALPNLFARNERVVAVFETAAGRMALVLVGALLVAGIETVWDGLVTPPTRRQVRAWPPPPGGVELDRGAEMGRFNMGSTVIALFEPGRVELAPGLTPGATVCMGRLLGRVESVA